MCPTYGSDRDNILQQQQQEQQRYMDMNLDPGFSASLPFPDNRLPPLKISPADQTAAESKKKLAALEVPLGVTSLDIFDNDSRYLLPTSDRAPPSPTTPTMMTAPRRAVLSADNTRERVPASPDAVPTRVVSPNRSPAPSRAASVPRYRTTYPAQTVPVFAPVPVRMPYWMPYYYSYQQHASSQGQRQRIMQQHNQWRRDLPMRHRINCSEKRPGMQIHRSAEQEQEVNDDGWDMDTEEVSTDDAMSIDNGATSSAVAARIAANHRNTSAAAAALTRPRWSADERLQLFLAVAEQKQLTDMSTFDWDKISKKFTVVERTNKSCKDQWRREVYKSIVKFLSDAADQDQDSSRQQPQLASSLRRRRPT